MKLPATIYKKLDSLKLQSISAVIDKISEDLNIELDTIANWLEQLLDVQIAHNDAERFKRTQRVAGFRWPNATLASSETLVSLMKTSTVEYLSSCNWIKEKTHVVLSGKSSSGKTTLACALGNEAIAEGYRVKFLRFRELLAMLLAAENRVEYIKLVKKLLRFDLIIIDDWVDDKLDKRTQAVLFEFIEKRELQGSFLISTQFDPATIHEALGSDVIADAIMSRIFPSSFRVELDHNIDFRVERNKCRSATSC